MLRFPLFAIREREREREGGREREGERKRGEEEEGDCDISADCTERGRPTERESERASERGPETSSFSLPVFCGRADGRTEGQTDRLRSSPSLSLPRPPFSRRHFHQNEHANVKQRGGGGVETKEEGEKALSSTIADGEIITRITRRRRGRRRSTPARPSECCQDEEGTRPA